MTCSVPLELPPGLGGGVGHEAVASTVMAAPVAQWREWTGGLGQAQPLR